MNIARHSSALCPAPAMLLVVRSVCCLLFLAVSISSAVAFAEGIMPFTTIERGMSSAIEDPVTQVFRSAEEFGQLWARHRSVRSPPPESPAVDFAANMVVCVYTGTKMTGGYSVEITNVQDTGSDIVVTYQTTDPPPGAIVTQSLTQPYHIVQMQKSSKKVVFEAHAAAAVSKENDGAPLTYLVTFDDKAQMGTIVEEIESVDGVESVKKLESIGIAIVTFDASRFDDADAMALLKGMAGVASVEKDQAF